MTQNLLQRTAGHRATPNHGGFIGNHKAHRHRFYAMGSDGVKKLSVLYIWATAFCHAKHHALAGVVQQRLEIGRLGADGTAGIVVAAIGAVATKNISCLAMKDRSFGPMGNEGCCGMVDGRGSLVCMALWQLGTLSGWLRAAAVREVPNSILASRSSD